MKQFDSSTDVPSSVRAIDLRWLLVTAGLLPAAIAGVDYAILNRTVNPTRMTIDIVIQFVWYVQQVGIVGYFVGHRISLPWLRWVVFGWILLLINLLTSTSAMNAANLEVHLPPAALFAGQIGLCVVWLFLGDTRWPIRLPVTIILAAAIMFLHSLLGPLHANRIWSQLLVLQVITLVALCGVLRFRGFHLAKLEVRPESPAAVAAERRVLQFNLKHVLTWTTALAILIGIARALGFLNWITAQEIVLGGAWWKLTVALVSGIVIIVALWVALGQGSTLTRYSIGLVFALLIGSGLSFWSRYNAEIWSSKAAGPWKQSDYELLEWFRIGWWWLGWMFLSSGLLAATLIILRVLGYRLIKRSSR